MASKASGSWPLAAAVCATASAIGSLSLAVSYRAGAQFDVNWEDVSAMPAKEAMTYMLEQSHNLSAWDAFLLGTRHLKFWIDLGQLWLVLFVFSFGCCAVVLWWQHRRRTPSNNAFEQTRDG